MTRRDPPARELQDQDIRALLDAQAPALSPADLDERIRRQAHAAVGDEQPVADAQQPKRNRTARMGSWMAVAAVVLLTVLLVPLLPTMNSGSPVDSVASHSAERSRAVSADSTVLSDSETVVEFAAVADTALVQEEVAVEQVIENSTAGIASKPSATVSSGQLGNQTSGLKAAAKSALSTKSQSGLGDSADDFATASTAEGLLQIEPAADREVNLPAVESLTLADIRATFSAKPYRRAELTWKDEIHRLHSAGNALEVVREVQLFERIYPGSSSGLPGGDR